MRWNKGNFLFISRYFRLFFPYVRFPRLIRVLSNTNTNSRSAPTARSPRDLFPGSRPRAEFVDLEKLWSKQVCNSQPVAARFLPSWRYAFLRDGLWFWITQPGHITLFRLALGCINAGFDDQGHILKHFSTYTESFNWIFKILQKIFKNFQNFPKFRNFCQNFATILLNFLKI